MSKRIRPKSQTPEQRLAWQREYQRKYYHAHREEAKKYQREYNQKYHKHRVKKPVKGVKNTKGALAARIATDRTRCFTASELMHEMNVTRFCRMAQSIIDGERRLIGTKG